MKLILSIFILVFIFNLEQIDKENPSGLSVENAIHKRISADTDKIYGKLVELRRDFHENPELAGNEKRTQEIIKQYLLDLGIEVVMDVHGYSIVGILKGEKKGKSIAWRADMDALPNDFPDKVDFKSKIKGIQHGCGHDVHLAIALGIAEILSKNKASLKGTVYFIFQSEEETFVGAKGMIDKGLFSKINPEEIYALHISALPVGEIMVKPNEMFAYQKRIRIKLKDELSKDETKALTAKIQSLLSRNQSGTKPWEIQSMLDPEIGLMNQNTIFKDYLFVDGQFNVYSKNGELFLEAYLYETNKSNLPKIIPEIEELLAKEKYTQKVISLSFIQENPTVINDENLTKKAIKSLNKIYGNNLMVNDFGQIPYFNDDFAYFQQKIPGVYFLLGGSNSEKGIVAMNHAPNFTVDEESIKIGVRSFSSLIIERLNTK
ncbi:M20 family metallopeptidase [Flavobacterium sp. AJR]|uniref:M20 metallopeptidase family protein n=1 Tax=unclassified Flavobacterium TaxID=196869 RepID=UPI000A3D83F3|nr:M20/M25/M40 family metallo-hydrolase [Flavobacterium sp. AJR]OUL62966.1 amidohydrolase [Flavobacterium sp. AJR]